MGIPVSELKFASGNGFDFSADHMFDGTKLKVQLSNNDLRVNVSGMEDSVVEVGEQLAWMGAALRSTGVDKSFSYCYPTTRFSFLPTQATSPLVVTFSIGYAFENISRNANTVNGRCWFPLFGNRTIVKGYPIPCRGGKKDDTQAGLEIPLNMMAGLVKATRVTKIDNQLLIKGFSTLFIPTKRIDDLVIWHMIFNGDDTHISYFDVRRNHIAEDSAKEVDFTCLERTRQILGWCSVVEHHTGTPTLMNPNMDLGMTETWEQIE
jgi:hypothetical protein